MASSSNSLSSVQQPRRHTLATSSSSSFHRSSSHEEADRASSFSRRRRMTATTTTSATASADTAIDDGRSSVASSNLSATTEEADGKQQHRSKHSRWTTALRRIVAREHHHDHHRGTTTTCDPVDPVGETLLRYMNGSASVFHYSNKRKTTPLRLKWTKPVLCQHNWHVLQQNWSDFTQLSWNELATKLLEVIVVSTTIIRPTARQLLWFVMRLLVFLLLLNAVLLNRIMIKSLQWTAWLVTGMSGYLIDWKGLLTMFLNDNNNNENNEPLQESAVFWMMKMMLIRPFRLLVIVIRTVFGWMDAHMFWGRRFAGREWFAEEFDWNTAGCYPTLFPRHRQQNSPSSGIPHSYPSATILSSSYCKSLFELPPPTIAQLGRRLGLDPVYVLSWVNNNYQDNNELQHQYRQQWSAVTAQHMAAIHFCYAMLREDQLRQQSHRSSKLRLGKQTSLNAASYSSSSSSPTKKRGSISYHNNAKHHEFTTSSSPPRRIRSSSAILVRAESSTERKQGIFGHLPEESFSEDIELKVTVPLPQQQQQQQQRLLWESEVNKNRRSSKKARNKDRLSSQFRTSNEDFDHDDKNDALIFFPGNAAHSGDVCDDDDDDDERIQYLSDLMEDAEDNSRTNHDDDDDDAVSMGSNVSYVGAADLPWIDVGARIGMRFLNSAHVQRAMSHQDTTDRILGQFGGGGGQIGATEQPSFASSLVGGIGGDIDSKNGRLITRKQQSAHAQHPQQPLSKPMHSMWTAVAVPTKVPSSALPMHSSGGSSSIITTTTKRNPATSSSRASVPPNLLRTMFKKREPLKPGVKVAIPLFPFQPGARGSNNTATAKTRDDVSRLQMATVVTSQRIWVLALQKQQQQQQQQDNDDKGSTNCLSVTVKLDRCFLRNGEFAELTFRVMDEWDDKYMPRHSKVPIGSCISTLFGIGVLVGWRVEDDCHVVRSLWQRRGPGSAHAYLNRNAIRGEIEAAVGFDVQTRFGWGTVLACANGSLFTYCDDDGDDDNDYLSVRYFVAIKEEGRNKGHVLELDRRDILSCHGAQFIPIIEHIREAATFQIQVDNYVAALREQALDEKPAVSKEENLFWKASSDCCGILWASFLRAVDEDNEFESGVNEFMAEIIAFLERLDEPTETSQDCELANEHPEHNVEWISSEVEIGTDAVNQEPGLWIIDELFGGVFRADEVETDQKSTSTDDSVTASRSQANDDASSIRGRLRSQYYERAFGVLRVLMKTVSIARAASVTYPHFRLSLALLYDFLLFLRTIVRVQQKNFSGHSQEIWKRAFDEIIKTFGPMKDRLEKIGKGIALRMEHQGRRAKVRLLKFVDRILGDERLLIAIEQGDWSRCLARLEVALLDANVVEKESIGFYRKVVFLILNQLQSNLEGKGDAATRNNEKLNVFARAVQSLASPRRSILKLFRRDDVLDLLERILVRAYYKEEVSTRMLLIHASNFHSLRQLRMLKDFSIAGRIWIPLLDAADEEFSWVVSRMPKSSKEIMCPLSSLFSLCVAQFHKIHDGDLSKDWLAFLLEEDSVRLIQDIDMKLILSLQSFSRDVSDMLNVLPYYPSIDDDILNLVDEVDLDKFLKEASEAMDNPEDFSHFLREKATIAIERFLNYLPKMSIPVEKRDLGGDMKGWVLTCRGEDGGDLRLSDVNIQRKNLVCKIMGDTVFFPMFSDDDDDLATDAGSSIIDAMPREAPSGFVEESVLDDIRELLLQAQKHGAWKSGVGGIGQSPTDRYVASVLQGLPVSGVLNCGIELWRNLEIDDDELMEIVIRDVSFQIQLQKEREEGCDKLESVTAHERISPLGGQIPSVQHSSSSGSQLAVSFESTRRRFNPRIDPTVLYLEMKRLRLQLDNFLFRIEKGTNRTMFDPVFEGRGMVSLQNVSICLRVECAKERVRESGVGVDGSVPILHLGQLDVELERVEIKVRDTGFGSDWLLNRAVHVFADNITKVVEENLREQIEEQAKKAIENLNSYFVLNPNIFLNILVGQRVKCDAEDDVSGKYILVGLKHSSRGAVAVSDESVVFMSIPAGRIRSNLEVESKSSRAEAREDAQRIRRFAEGHEKLAYPFQSASQKEADKSMECQEGIMSSYSVSPTLVKFFARHMDTMNESEDGVEDRNQKAAHAFMVLFTLLVVLFAATMRIYCRRHYRRENES